MLLDQRRGNSVRPGENKQIPALNSRYWASKDAGAGR